MDHETAVAKVEKALEDAGLFPCRLTDSILNVHAAPLQGGSSDDQSYVATVTVTITA